MKISVIIPVYNALEDTKKCIKSVLENADLSYTTLTVIDDCSDTETADMLSELKEQTGNKFQIIRNETNLGFIKTCNKGLSSIDADIYVLLNSDTIIPKNFCEKIVKCFETTDAGIASPIGSYSSRYYILHPINMNLNDINNYIESFHNAEYPEIPSCEGFCFCIRKNTIDSIGYLDTIYGKGYCEEIDFSYRAVKNGLKCRLIDNLYVYHKNNRSFGNKKRREYLEKNLKIFNERWGNFYENWIHEHKHINPIKKLRKEFFKGKFITNCETAYMVNIFGKLLKIKK